MNQREAFLVQARSDFQICTLLREQEWPACHWLHYLQMATEKLGKAVRLSPSGGTAFKQSHVVFSKLTAILQRQVSLASALHMDPATYRWFIDSTSRLRSEIEHLAPDRAAGRPNAEYPWRARNAQGDWLWYAPAQWSFPLDEQLRSSEGRALLKLISVLLVRFEEIF